MAQYKDIYPWYLQKFTSSTKNLTFTIPLIQFQLIFHKFMTLSSDDLKLYLRSTYIHNWYLQRCFNSKINNCTNTWGFITPWIVTKSQLKYDVYHIMTENSTWGGHMYRNGISQNILSQIKISPLIAAILKLKYQYQ